MPTKMEYKEIPINEIEISSANVRKDKDNIEEGLDELAKSIKEIGLQQPVVVYQKQSKYHLIVGQRRYLAYKKLGFPTIPALIRSVKNETDATIISFSENIHRLDLEYRDKMRVAVELLDKLNSITEVAKALGVSEQTVRNYIGYAAVPEELKKMVDSKKISATTATRIARNIPDEKEAIEIAKKIKEEPSNERRRLIIDIAKANPGKNASQIVKIARREKFHRKITISLTPRVASALEAACRDYGGDPKDIASEALEEWLKGKGFLK